MKCSLCKGQIEIKGTWKEGNNAEPIKRGRCCDVCNITKVIPARLRRVIRIDGLKCNFTDCKKG
jgi:hypothetical protein